MLNMAIDRVRNCFVIKHRNVVFFVHKKDLTSLIKSTNKKNPFYSNKTFLVQLVAVFLFQIIAAKFAFSKFSILIQIRQCCRHLLVRMDKLFICFVDFLCLTKI